MPAVSKKQRIAMAIAEHHPEKLYARNRGLTKLSSLQLHDFASTKESGLPVKKRNMVQMVKQKKQGNPTLRRFR